VFDQLDAESTLRLHVYDIPPASTTLVDVERIVTAFRARLADDAELFAVQAARFMDGPHVLERLLDHLMELRAIEAPNFITVTKGLSDELRGLLQETGSPVKIHQVPHSHLELWAGEQGSPMVFVDGGVAKLGGYPGIEQ
jgi:hypothetical protein